jgi:hypothetical protein
LDFEREIGAAGGADASTFSWEWEKELSFLPKKRYGKSGALLFEYKRSPRVERTREHDLEDILPY